MKVVVISGSPRKTANTLHMMKFVYNYAKSKNNNTIFINLAEGIDYYRGPDMNYSESTKQAVRDVTDADVWLIGTPVYNSFFSSALKNLFEYINYKQTAGKVAGLSIIASGNISFTSVQTLITQLMSYFGVITNPKAVYMTADMINNNTISVDAQKRLKDMVDNTVSLATRVIQS